MTRARPGQAIAEFHRLRLIATDECVIWPFAKTQDGYGMVGIPGVRRSIETHRWALILVTGGDRPGMAAAHSCRSRACLNTRHLRWATHVENAADKDRDGTQLRGEQVPTAKLTEDRVREIRMADGSKQSIAERFGVSRATVRRILSGETWRHVR